VTLSNDGLRYLELLKQTLTRFGLEDPSGELVEVKPGPLWSVLGWPVWKVLAMKGLGVARRSEPSDLDMRRLGRDWPRTAETMIGLERLSQLQQAIMDLSDRRVRGDIVETGVWRGGASILLTEVLNVMGDPSRKVFVADSFEGLPPPDPRYPVDDGDPHHQIDYLRVSRAEVEANFRKFRVDMRRVHFIEGWFSETLHRIPSQEIALLRLDGDMYSSTMQALEALYDRVVPGGYVVVDDYNLIGAHQAVHDFLNLRRESVEFVDIDGAGVYWVVE
jgi:O-methyltransferase